LTPYSRLQRRAAKQFDIGNKQPVNQCPALHAQHTDDESQHRAKEDRADGMGHGPAEPEPEQVGVFAEDGEIPNVLHGLA